MKKKAEYDFFTNPSDLQSWVRSRGSGQEASSELLDVIQMIGDQDDVPDDTNDIVEMCETIFQAGDDEREDAASILFGVLAKHNVINMTKEAKNMKRQAQTYRQRNQWTRGQRNKWNRYAQAEEVHPNTQWRRNRNQFYGFIHNDVDALRFDEDPENVYSGEAIWRMYIMDKFTREHKDKNGKWVGGYINDRFYTFPDAGTPSNPDVPRDGGNQMELAHGERTRKPRPHQYSIERRMEEARGNETNDLEVSANSFDVMVKVASTLPKERNENRIYNMFRDVIDMREAGFEYENILEKVAEHYDATIPGVAQIEKVARKMVDKHSGIAYEINKTAQNRQTFIVTSSIPVTNSSNGETMLQEGTTVVKIDDNTFQIVDGSDAGVSFKLPEGVLPEQVMASADADGMTIQDGADEVGLNE